MTKTSYLFPTQYTICNWYKIIFTLDLYSETIALNTITKFHMLSQPAPKLQAPNYVTNYNLDLPGFLAS